LSAAPSGWIAANALALALLALALAGWARRDELVRRHAFAGGASVALAIAASWMLFDRVQVPIGWVSVLMEGRSLRNIQQLYGECVHFGGGFYAFLTWLAGHGAGTLRAVVEWNLGLAAVNAVLFFILATHVLRSPWVAFPFALGYALNLNTVHAALSETPATGWATVFFLGCVAGSAIAAESAGPRLRRVALLALAALAALAAWLRVELLAVGAPAVAAAAVRTLGWEAPARAAARAAGRALRSLLGGRSAMYLAACGILIALEYLPLPGSAGWVLAGLRPFNLSFLTLPWTLGSFLSPSLVALIVLGTVYALRRWTSFHLLPVGFLVLFKIYAAAGHGVFLERFRYATFLTPVALFLSLFGARQVVEWARQRAWPSWWKRVAGLLLLTVFAPWQAPWPKELLLRRHELPGLATPGFLLGLNQQSEVRYLLDLMARFPSCAFVAKVASSEMAWGDRGTGRWVAFGAPVLRFRALSQGSASPEEAADQLGVGGGCVLYYQTLDCSLRGFEGCERDLEGRAALEERVLENLPYSDVEEYGAHRAEVRLGVYPVRRRELESGGAARAE
jgi:hypothetical protein